MSFLTHSVKKKKQINAPSWTSFSDTCNKGRKQEKLMRMQIDFSVSDVDGQ